MNDISKEEMKRRRANYKAMSKQERRELKQQVSAQVERDRMTCKRCGGHMQVQVVNKVGSKSSAGAFGWLFWGLLAVPTCGLALLIPLLRSGKTTSHMEKHATCAACGHSERRF